MNYFLLVPFLFQVFINIPYLFPIKKEYSRGENTLFHKMHSDSSKFYRLHLARNNCQPHRSIAIYLYLPVSGLHHHDAPVCQMTTTSINLLVIFFQQTGKYIKHGRPYRIHQLARFWDTTVRYLQVETIKTKTVLVQTTHGGIRFRVQL